MIAVRALAREFPLPPNDWLIAKLNRCWRPIAIALFVSACCIFLLSSQPQPLAYLDNKVLDLLVAQARPHRPTQQVVTVDIDEASLAKIGPWPWSRDVLAKLVRRITEAGSSVIALDLILTAPGSDPARDRLLASALRQSHAIAGFDFVFDSAFNRSTSCLQMPKPLSSASAFPASQFALPEASAVICDSPVVESQISGSGFLNSFRDHDGVVRQIPLLVAYRGAVYPSFALAVALSQSVGHPFSLTKTQSQGIAIRYQGKQIGLHNRDNLLLRQSRPRQPVPSYSAAEVLNGLIGFHEFDQKVVVLGSSADGREETLESRRDRVLPALDLQALAIDNLIADDFFYRPAWTEAVQIAGIVLFSLLTVFFLFEFSAAFGLISAGLLLALVWLSSQSLLAFQAAFISPVPALCACAGCIGICAVRIFLKQSRSSKESREELAVANRFITGALGAMTAVRDVETGQHVVRIQGYLHSLCQVVALRPRFAAYLTPPMIELLVQLAPIHDIGKVGVPDYVLRKPGALSREEFELMKSHVSLGKQILEEARQHSGLRNQLFFQTAVDIVYSHHEWWDGTGYPVGLKGDFIPVPGRLLAVADVYDALISKRHYKSEFLHAEAVERIRLGSGNHFDPEIVEAFLSVQDDWRRMAESHRDEPKIAVATT